MFQRSHITLRRGCGICGLPNVGKSTLHNALTCSLLSKTGNFEFCTLEAQHAKVAVYDEALAKCAAFAHSKKTYYSEIDMVDVPGLIKGASQGLGCGNKFLQSIRQSTVLLHMVRCFESVRDSFDRPQPLDAIATIESELIIADMESVEKRVTKNKRGGGGTSSSKDFDEVAFTKDLLAWLEDGKPARTLPAIQSLPSTSGGDDNGGGGSSSSSSRERAQKLNHIKKAQQALEPMQLLSAKPTIFVLNVDEDSMKHGNEFSKQVEDFIGADRCVKVCSLIEEQCAQMTREERLELLNAYEIDKPAVESLLQRVFDLLKLQSFYTIGPLMAKAWPIRAGTTAREAAGEIHGDFEKHFRAARVLPWSKFVAHPNLKVAETKMVEVSGNYVMEPSDVMIVEHDAKK